MLKFLLFLLITIYVINYVNADPMIEIFKWKQIDFYNRGDGMPTHNVQKLNKKPGVNNPSVIVFPDRLSKLYKRSVTSRDDPLLETESRWNSNPLSTNTNTSTYIPENIVPMGATKFGKRLFITLPRRRVGIPSTLNYIDLIKDGTKTSPKLYAYPDFQTNNLNPNHTPNPNRIISVYRTHVDACKRLWFIDTGMLEYPNNRIQVQRPAIWIIDLNTDVIIHRFEIPESIVDTGRGLASITPDVENTHCDLAYAYIPDLINARLYVYSLHDDHIWSFSHNYFNFDPLAGDLNVGGQTFRWDDGIFSITLGPYLSDSSGPYRLVFFHAMASTNEFMVSNRVLRNETNAQRDDHGNDFKLMGNRGSGKQSTMHVFDPKTGVLFYDEIQRDGIGCWNSAKPFNEANHGTVSQHQQQMIYPSDLTIDEDDNIWVMSNSMPIFIYSHLDFNIYNFRVWKQNTYSAANNRICGIGKPIGYHH